MKTIEENADEYCRSTLVGSQFVKKTSYIQGAKDVLRELMMTISVSDDKYIKDNIERLIEELKGNLTFEKEVLDGRLPF